MQALIEQLDEFIIPAISESLGAGRPPDIESLQDSWETDDYPSGRSRVKAKWYVEVKGKKSRIARQTESTRSPGVWMSPKRTTYAPHSQVGVGRDGKTYLVQGGDGPIVVWDGTMTRTMRYNPSTEGHDPGDDLAKRMGMIKVISHYDGGAMPDVYMYLRRKAGKPTPSGPIEVVKVMMVKKARPVPKPEPPLPANSSKMTGADFIKEIERGIKKGYVKASAINQYDSNSTGTVWMSYFNLGKEHENHNVNPTNNRFSFTIKGFGKKEGDPPPKGKVKVEMTSGSYYGEKKIKYMRAKTAPPEKLVPYLLKYIEEINKKEPSLQTPLYSR